MQVGGTYVSSHMSQGAQVSLVNFQATTQLYLFTLYQGWGLARPERTWLHCMWVDVTQPAHTAWQMIYIALFWQCKQ